MLKSLKINTSNEKWNEPLRPLQFKTGYSGLFLWLRAGSKTGWACRDGGAGKMAVPVARWSFLAGLSGGGHPSGKQGDYRDGPKVRSC